MWTDLSDVARLVAYPAKFELLVVDALRYAFRNTNCFVDLTAASGI
jgi:hypothetical protein